jgi:hypothetical protein
MSYSEYRVLDRTVWCVDAMMANVVRENNVNTNVSGKVDIANVY